MHSNFFPFEVATAAVLLPGSMVMPAIAAAPPLRGSRTPAGKDRVVTPAEPLAATRPIVDHQTRTV
jgi:hypothetical protein